jgi:hypothetical protein
MTKILRMTSYKQLHGWQLAANVTIGLCCKVVIPALQFTAQHGNLKTTVSVAGNPPAPSNSPLGKPSVLMDPRRFGSPARQRWRSARSAATAVRVAATPADNP